MPEADLFADSEALASDLELQELLLWARTAVPSRLLDASIEPDDTLAEVFRLDAMYQFCEFFYLLKARDITSVEAIQRLAEIHNLHIDMLTRDTEKMRRLGLRKDRLLDAVFTSDTLPRLVETWRELPGRIDQSNLARFFVTVMSSETCRKLVVAAASAGFLERTKSPWGTVLVRSTGTMEAVIGGVLRELRGRITEISLSGDQP